MSEIILRVKNIEINNIRERNKKIIDNISFDLVRGETLGIAGESGSGKTILVKSILNMLPDSCRLSNGEVLFEGKDLYKISRKELQTIRGYKIAMISDNPYEILDPIVTVEKQVRETIKTYNNLSNKEATEKALSIFKLLKMPDPEKMLYSYPYQLSGGMQQRVSIALALCGDVDLLIADDATRSLDVTIAAQIVEMLREMVNDKQLSMLWITHSLPMCSLLSNKIMIIHDGKVLEMGMKNEILKNPRHFYTKVLMQVAPNLSQKRQNNYMFKNISGEISVTMNSCSFINVCPECMEICRNRHPDLQAIDDNHFCRCFLYGNK